MVSEYKARSWNKSFLERGVREYWDIRGRIYKEDGECYFTVSFVIFSVQETYKSFIKNLKRKDFFVDQSAGRQK